jgi:hypothetical protein
MLKYEIKERNIDLEKQILFEMNSVLWVDAY